MKIIIFDLYDTLIYCPRELKQKPYKKLFEQLGLTKSEMNIWVNRIMTNEYDFQSIISEAGHSGINTDYLNSMLESEISSVRPFDDTIKCLSNLKDKYRIFCLSNLATPYKRPYFELGLDKFIEKPFFSCDCGTLKPEREFFEMVLSYSGCNPQDAIMIGDNPISDFKGAQDCGIKAILKNRTLSEIISEL